MDDTYEKLKCRKWNEVGENRFTCAQTQDSPCICQSSICIPRVDLILSDSQKQKRDNFLAEVKNNIKSGTAALVLGAGISKPSKVPLWGELISKMMGYAIQYDYLSKEHFSTNAGTTTSKCAILRRTNQLIQGNLSLLSKVNALEAAEYVAQFFDDCTAEDSIREHLPESSVRSMIERMLNNAYSPRELLYANCCIQRNTDTVFSSIADALNAEKTIAEALDGLERKKIAQLNTMFAVAYLMSHPCGIYKAMSYNYDPLVQEHMLDLFGVDNKKIITHPGKQGKLVGDDTREIYHIHGFVAGQRQLSRSLPDIFPSESGPLILSEDSYYRIEREEAYNWSSSVQSSFFNRYKCIFVGFSAEDYNFRRILRQMGRRPSDNRPRHYLILTIDDWIKNTYEDICHTCFQGNSQIDGNSVKEVSADTALLLQYILQCREDYWDRYNISPIWVTVEDIPEILTNLID